MVSQQSAPRFVQARLALIPFPSENRFTPAKASLGKKLYFDPRLSAASSQSCASCHSPGFGWGRRYGVRIGTRHDPTGTAIADHHQFRLGRGLDACIVASNDP
jgi:cytochrome c peroxidase